MKTYSQKQKELEFKSKIYRFLIKSLIKKWKTKEITRNEFYSIKSSIDDKYGFCASSSKIILV